MSESRLITPSGMKLGDELDLLYMIVKSLQVSCKKLDADAVGPVTDTDYEALCYTAIINTIINDTKGNRIGQMLTTDPGSFNIIGPASISSKARIDLLYQLFLAWSTLLTKADADLGTSLLTTSYSNQLGWRVQNAKGTILGGTGYLFNAGGGCDQKELVDLYYAIVDAISDVTAALDALTTIDTDYKALCYTAIIKVQVQNSQGNTIGN
jgi:hypothetical protein